MTKKKSILSSLFLLLSLLLNSCNQGEILSAEPGMEDYSVSASSTPAKTWDTNPIETLSGSLDYVLKGCSLSSTEKSCDNLKKGNISISIPTGAKVKRAYLFWAASGINDANVTLDGSKVVSTIKTKIINKSNFVYYKNYSDVTNYVATKGSGIYNVSDFSFQNGGVYCDTYGSLGVASLMVVYELPGLPNCDIHVFLGDLASTAYMNKLVKENYYIPVSGTPSSCTPCKEHEVQICINWCEGDSYKNEYCKLLGKVLGENTLNGSEAPNLDIDTYEGFSMPSNRIIPLEFKGYLIKKGYQRMYESCFTHCVVIKVLKGNNGKVCSCATGADGKPLANQTIKIKNEEGQVVEVTTDANGQWCKELPKGKYTIVSDGGTQITGQTEFEVKACTCITLPCIVVKPPTNPPATCPDADGDGVCDAVDACPSVSGVPENDGCPQIAFNSISDLSYTTNFASVRPSTANSALTNIIATPTAADQTTLSSYYILSMENFTPTVGAEFSVKSVALKGISTYGTILSKTHNIKIIAKVEYYNPVSKIIRISYSGSFEEQGLSSTRTFNISGYTVCKYEKQD